VGKTIAILSEDFPEKSGGIAQWAAGAAQGLHGLGHRVIVITRRWKEYPAPAEGTYDFPVRFIPGNHWKKLRSWYWRKAIKALYAEGIRPDLLIATTWNAGRGTFGMAARHRTRTALVVHGLEVTRRMGCIKQWWCGNTLHKADTIVAVSAFTGQRVADAFSIDKNKMVTIPNGVDILRFKPGIDSSALRGRLGLHNRNVLLTLARIVERKGQDQVIRALPTIIRKIPDVTYCVAGDPRGDHTQTLKALVAELRLENHVRFAGYVEPAELPAFYNLCEVYVMPSREIVSSGDTEGFGITFLEANACEKPVIGGNSGGVMDAIVDGETGFLVDPLDPAAIAEKAILLLTDETLSKKLGRQGRERIVKGFTWRAITERMMERICSHGDHKGHGEHNE
jgi:phosphatidylinositol alpha-1,6-mannosyltransferase